MSVEQRAAAPACMYSQNEAVEFAQLSTAAYCGSIAHGWHCGEACESVPGMSHVRTIDDEDLGAHAYVGRLREQCVLAFRGTDSLNGWAQDLASVSLVNLEGCSFRGEACRVGQGFLEDYRSLRVRIQRELAAIGCGKSDGLLVTGHSLGGALAALALFDLTRLGQNISKAYTFGQPRVGDAAFAGAFNAALARIPVYRVTKADDPIVYLPARDPFHHVGREVYYAGETSEGYRVCDGSGEDRRCQDANPTGDVAFLLAQCLSPETCGHLNYLRPALSTHLSPATCSVSQTLVFP